MSQELELLDANQAWHLPMGHPASTDLPQSSARAAGVVRTARISPRPGALAARTRPRLKDMVPASRACAKRSGGPIPKRLVAEHLV